MYKFLIGLFVAIIIIVVVFNSSFLTIAFVISVFALIVFLIRNRVITERIYSKSKDELHIVNVDKGGVFILSGVGENSEELTLKVVSKHLYQEGDFYWYELECDKGTGENVWVEVEDDDSTIVSITLKKMTLKDIHVTSDKLEKIDDEETGSITYNGQQFVYVDSDNAVFYKHCDNQNPQKFYFWDFAYKNQIISVEKWTDFEYDVTLSQRMLPAQIKVLSNKGA